MSIKSWISAARLRTLPLAAASTLTGSALAWHEGKGNVAIFIWALLTTFLLQILSNFANDYGDYSHGVDNEKRVGPTRTMQSGAITKNQMKRALILCSGLALTSGLLLLWISFGREGLFGQALFFLVLGIAAIAAAFKYTVGKNPYGYSGLGDVFVFLFFGIVGVCGTCFLYSRAWNPWGILPAITIGLLSVGVLNLNNLRDHVNDAASGKRTLVVRMGFKNGKIYQLIIVVSALLSMMVWMILFNTDLIQWLPSIVLVLPIILLIKIFKIDDPSLLDTELKKVALSSFLFSLLFFIFH